MASSTHKKRTPIKHHARRLLVPHKGNQYRPHLVRLRGIAAVLAIILLAQIVYGVATTGHIAVLGRVTTVDATQLLAETNNARAKAGLPALTVNEDLNRAAALKAQDMITNDYWSHNSPTGISPWKWLTDVGYNYSVAGENLAKNYPNAAATVDAWMDSESHRQNILNQKYTDVGFAVTEGVLGEQDTTLVVAYYGSPQVASATTSNSSELNVAPVTGSIGSILGYFASALQSLSPATIISLMLLAGVILVASLAHHFRKLLPKEWRKTWRSHHGMFIVIGAVGLAMIMIFATGGGQI